MKYSATFPTEPDGPVRDVEGVAYHRDAYGRRGEEGRYDRFTWRGLLAKVGPVTDVAPLDPDVGRLYLVYKEDEPEKTYVCLRPYGSADHMNVVLPAEQYDTVIHISDIAMIRSLAVVPQSSVGDISEEFVWMAHNTHLQPDVVYELGLTRVWGKDRMK